MEFNKGLHAQKLVTKCLNYGAAIIGFLYQCKYKWWLLLLFMDILFHKGVLQSKVIMGNMQSV
jgi:hypothetical protein